MSEFVPIPEIAKRLRLDSSTVRRFIAREGGALNIQIHRGKSDRVLLTREDADKLIASYEARRGAMPVESEDTATFDRHGYFYIIQLIPEAVPNRVKVGFADSVEKRVAEHRTAAPTAKLLKTWPCKRSWDFAAMDSITRSDCKLVLNEVYEGDINGFITRGDDFFAHMPDPNVEKELSEYSPLSAGPIDSEPESSDATAI